MSTNTIVELNQDNFQDMAIAFDGVSVVDFWSTSCVPCKQMTRILEEIVCDMPTQVRISKVNVDQNALLLKPIIFVHYLPYFFLRMAHYKKLKLALIVNK